MLFSIELCAQRASWGQARSQEKPPMVHEHTGVVEVGCCN